MAKLRDGHSTRITFPSATGAELYETEIAPPGWSGGGANDTTSMHNTGWRTRQPKKLKTATDITGTAQFATSICTTLNTLINNNQLVEVKFPDASTLSVWSWLDEFKFNPLKEGEPPTASFTVIPSNEDATGVEVAPAYSAGS